MLFPAFTPYYSLLPTVNWELVARHKGYMDAANLMGSFSALVPVVVRLIHSPPPLGAASVARVYRVLAAVVSSLRERTR